jgi:hypothetical protein
VRVLVSGDRNWTDRAYIFDVLDKVDMIFGQIEVIIEGEARGADLIARAWAQERRIPFEPYPAQWDLYRPPPGSGRKNPAGPIRNRQMLTEGRPDMVLAFHPDLSQSKGTLDMVRAAREAGVPVKVFNGRDDDGEAWLDILVSGAVA